LGSEDTLHHLVDTLPDSEIAAAERYLRGVQTDDPVLRTLLTAPLDDEPETDEERAAVAGAYADMRRGRLVSMEEIKREFGGGAAA
jgi:hypothetical protein